MSVKNAQDKKDAFLLVLDQLGTAKNISIAIERSGISVSQLATMLAVENQTVYLWRSASPHQIRTPSIDNLIRLAYVLDTSVDELLAVKKL